MTPRSHHATQLLRAARLCEELGNGLYDEAINHSRRQVEAVDGYPSGNDNPNVAHSSELTSVEAAAAAREFHRLAIADLEAGVRQAIITINDLVDSAHRARRGAVVVDKPKLCDCSGHEGATLPRHEGWSDPTCRNIATRGTLCDACAQRKRRWKLTIAPNRLSSSGAA